ncbi:hypothetical protein A2480_02635 [Candidatus Uhrbacteria bacterium RIFOXYC2_FULL_47_19]|uniref:Uncharacterized protein n=1 Tax=Candidatus Uhrbacteria bacterium RIFOXYC2_FULL_47_19 TaxID=1802424 RepID=A0A1F7WGN4_9BACT|nr:MAG: hypothetical protein A2480_02635 [Candidatus Uhrbacteria bacterium RIFOXYC2_FULL_47_19]HCC22248.1 hypothetical protein [Candidatus Uhrbacteria bacterium]
MAAIQEQSGYFTPGNLERHDPSTDSDGQIEAGFRRDVQAIEDAEIRAETERMQLGPLTITENDDFRTIIDDAEQGGYLEVIKFDENYFQEKIVGFKERLAELGKSLKKNFEIDDPETYSDRLPTSFVAMLKHEIRVATEPGFGIIFDEFQRLSDDLLNTQSKLEELKNGQPVSVADELARTLADQKAYQIKRAALRAVRGNRGNNGSSTLSTIINP